MAVPPYSPGTGAAWPPQPTGSYGTEEVVNDSGQHAGVPPQIAQYKWNWGAFCLDWIWCLNHGMVAWGLGLLLLPWLLGWVPILGIVIALGVIGVRIYLGLSGHKLAWQNRRFEGGVPQYLEVETAWKNWGLGLVVIGLILVPILAAILFPVFAQARAKALARHRTSELVQPHRIQAQSPIQRQASLTQTSGGGAIFVASMRV